MNQIIGNLDLSERLYYQFADIVYRHAGIALGDVKRELVRARLIKRLRALNIPTFEDYYDLIAKGDPKGDENQQMLDAISTNKTDFFREIGHFNFLTETVLPKLADRAKFTRSSRLRFWSAGCSSGEEPYTLAMLLRDQLEPALLRDTKIFATDISISMLETAQEGLYETGKTNPIPPKLRLASFTKETTDKGDFYRVRPEVKKMIAFRGLNLMSQTYPFKGKFDVIFCRNVMIYFDRPTQEALVNRFARYMHPGGYLFIGHSESLGPLKTPFQFVKPTIYLRP